MHGVVLVFSSTLFKEVIAHFVLLGLVDIFSFDLNKK